MTTPTENSIRNWFDRLYGSRREHSMRPSAAYISFLDYLPVKAGEKLLDIGCGTGWLLKAASKKGLFTCGIDVSAEAIKLSRKNSPVSVVELASVTKIPFPSETFDYITCIGVLEHFTDMEKAFIEMKRVAKKSAMFCLMVPNSKTLYWKLGKCFKKEYRESNENAFSLKEWQMLFEDHGMEIQQISRDDWRLRKLLGYLGITSNSRLYNFIRHMVWSLIPLSRAHQFIYILRIKS